MMWTFDADKILKAKVRIEIDSEKYPTEAEAWAAVNRGEGVVTELVGEYGYDPIFLRYENTKMTSVPCDICGKPASRFWMGKHRCDKHDFKTQKEN